MNNMKDKLSLRINNPLLADIETFINEHKESLEYIETKYHDNGGRITWGITLHLIPATMETVKEVEEG